MEDQLLLWFDVKQRLRETPRDPPLVSESDIWWICFGRNIGTEIDGKSRYFSRPAVIIRKLTNQTFLVAPMTTQLKTGSWYVLIRQNDKSMRVCLHQLRTIDYRRLTSKMGSIDDEDMRRIRIGFWKLYK